MPETSLALAAVAPSDVLTLVRASVKRATTASGDAARARMRYEPTVPFARAEIAQEMDFNEKYAASQRANTELARQVVVRRAAGCVHHGRLTRAPRNRSRASR